MIIQNLIWSKVVVKDESGDVIDTLTNVSARYVNGELLHIRQYTSSQGTSTDKQMNYSYPELFSMNVQGITLKAFLWGTTPKDTPITIELEF